MSQLNNKDYEMNRGIELMLRRGEQEKNNNEYDKKIEIKKSLSIFGKKFLMLFQFLVLSKK